MILFHKKCVMYLESRQMKFMQHSKWENEDKSDRK